MSDSGLAKTTSHAAKPFGSGRKRQQKPGKAGTRFAKAGKGWQGQGNAAKAAEKLRRISQHQFSGVKLIE